MHAIRPVGGLAWPCRLHVPPDPGTVERTGPGKPWPDTQQGSSAVAPTEAAAGVRASWAGSRGAHRIAQDEESHARCGRHAQRSAEEVGRVE